MAKLTATAEQIRSTIELHLRFASDVEGRCRDCAAPMPIPIDRRGDGVNWTVAHFPHLPEGCAPFMMKVLDEVMRKYDLVDGEDAPSRARR
jgi:hypothetical protein